MNSKFSFRPIVREDLSLIQKWLAEPHVQEWWHESLTLEEVERKYGPRIDGVEKTYVFLIHHDRRPIGLIQWYLWSDYPDHAAQLGASSTAAGVDLAIGEKQSVGKGLGSILIREFVNKVIFEKSTATAVVTDPEEQNLRSRRAFEKAGFTTLRKAQLRGETQQRLVMGIDRAP